MMNYLSSNVFLDVSSLDEDGDHVTVSCDEELNVAVHATPRDQDILKLYVKGK